MADRQLILYGALVCLIIAAVMVPLGLAAAILSSTTLLCLIIAAVMVPSVLLVVLLLSLRLGHDAIQVNLDEFIRANKAQDVLLGLEELSQEDGDQIRGHYQELAEEAHKEDASSPLVMVG